MSIMPTSTNTDTKRNTYTAYLVEANWHKHTAYLGEVGGVGWSVTILPSIEPLPIRLATMADAAARILIVNNTREADPYSFDVTLRYGGPELQDARSVAGRLTQALSDGDYYLTRLLACRLAEIVTTKDES